MVISFKGDTFQEKTRPVCGFCFLVAWFGGWLDGWLACVLGVKAYTPDKRSRRKPVEENATAPPRSCPQCVIVDSRFDPIRIGSGRVGRSPYKKPQYPAGCLPAFSKQREKSRDGSVGNSQQLLAI